MDELTEAELSHEIYLNKLSSFYANKWEDIEPLVVKAIRQAFSEFDDISTKAEANALNDRIDELLTPILEEAVAEQEQANADLKTEFEALGESGIATNEVEASSEVEDGVEKYLKTINKIKV